MQIIVNLNIPITEFIQYLGKNPRVGKIISFYNEMSRKALKNNTLVLNQEIADSEAIIFYYLYSFTCYGNMTYIDNPAKRRAFLTSVWESILEFIDNFKNPMHPNTTIWILEIFAAFASKFLPKDVIDGRNIRSPLHITVNNHLLQLSSILSKEYKIVFRPEKVNLSYTVIPLPPSVFEFYMKNQDNAGSRLCHPELFDLTQNSEGVLTQRYKIYSLIFLDKLSVPLMKNSYAANKMERMTMRVSRGMTPDQDIHGQDLHFVCGSKRGEPSDAGIYIESAAFSVQGTG
jgi:hypothetical protein